MNAIEGWMLILGTLASVAALLLIGGGLAALMFGREG